MTLSFHVTGTIGDPWKHSRRRCSRVGPSTSQQGKGQGKDFSYRLQVNPDSKTALVKLRRLKCQTYGKVASWIRVQSQYSSTNIVPKVRASMPKLADVEAAKKSMVVLFSHS